MRVVDWMYKCAVLNERRNENAVGLETVAGMTAVIVRASISSSGIALVDFSDGCSISLGLSGATLIHHHHDFNGNERPYNRKHHLTAFACLLNVHDIGEKACVGLEFRNRHCLHPYVCQGLDTYRQRYICTFSTLISVNAV